MTAAYTDHTAWPPRNPGESLRDWRLRFCAYQADERRVHDPERQAYIDSFNAKLEAGRNYVSALAKIHGWMAASGKALIVDDGVLLEMPASRDERRAAA